MNEEKKKNTSVSRKGSTTKKSTTKKSTTKKGATAKTKATASKKTTTKKVTSSKPVKKSEPVVEKEKKKVIEKVEISKPVEVVEAKEEVKEVSLKKKSSYNDSTIRMLSIVAIVLAFVLVAVASFKFFHQMENVKYSEEWVGKSYLVSKNVVHQISLGEILNVVNNEDTFIFVTTLENEEEFELEKDLKKIVLDYQLESRFFVYPIEEANKVKAFENLQIASDVKVPTILYYQNGNLVDSVQREDQKMMEAADFVHLLDIYEFKK